MKTKLQIALCCVFLLSLFSSTSMAQYKLDPGFSYSTSILPKDIPGWPDSIGAEKVLAGFDFNNNGKKEFITMACPEWYGDDSRPYLFWFEANGNDSYTLLWSTHMPGLNEQLFSYSDFTVGDMDKDGLPEIIVATPISTTDSIGLVYFYEFDGTTFPSTPTLWSRVGVPYGWQYRVSGILTDDVDNDGDVELVMISRRDDFSGTPGSAIGRTMIVAHLQGDIVPGESFSYLETEFADSSSTLKGGGVYDFAITDFDGDGKKEIWVFTWDLWSLAIYEADAPDHYALQADINQARPDNDVGAYHSMKFYDGDNDGKLEMYVAGNTNGDNPGNLYCIDDVSDVSTLTTESVATVTSDMPPLGGYVYEAADIGEVDGNGKMDYIVTGAGPRRCAFRLEYQSGPATDSSSYTYSVIFEDTLTTDALYNFMTAAIGNDIDGDGKKEIFLTNLHPLHGHPDAAIVVVESNTPSTAVKQGKSMMVNGYDLEQNYPNPFNPATTINFTTPVTQFVSVKVYDLAGRLVSTLVNQVLQAGGHSTVWNSGNLASGSYIVTMKAGSFQKSVKMDLLK